MRPKKRVRLNATICFAAYEKVMREQNKRIKLGLPGTSIGDVLDDFILRRKSLRTDSEAAD